MSSKLDETGIKTVTSNLSVCLVRLGTGYLYIYASYIDPMTGFFPSKYSHSPASEIMEIQQSVNNGNCVWAARLFSSS
jgi:hypothetical protein